MKKYIIGSVMMLTLLFGVGAPEAKALTSVEAEAIISALQLNSSQAQAIRALVTKNTPVGGYVFTRNLTIGSTGNDVVALQTWLEARGFLTIPAGVAKGYFGPLTRSALAAYQASVGISPAVGYFGPITRTNINSQNPSTGGDTSGGGTVTCPAGFTCTPVDGGSGSGDEGQLVEIDETSSLSSEEVMEDEEDVEVLGFEYEAEDSDMTIERVDVDFTHTGSSGSDNLDDYITEVSIFHNGSKVASADVDEADEDDDVYSFRFSGLDIVTKDGEADEITVAVSGVRNIDSDDEGQEWTVEIPANGIRAIDEAGLSETYGDTDEIETTFTVETLSSAGDLELNVSLSDEDDINESHVVEVSNDSDTNEVEILAFEIEAEGSNMTVEDLPIFLTATGANVNVIINRLTLEWDGGDESETVTIAATTGTTTFSDLGIEIEEGETMEFVVKADVNELDDTNFTTGDTLKAELRGNSEVDAIDAEDQNGDSVGADDLTGSALGEDITFFTEGINVEVTDTTEDRSNTSDSDPNSIGTYTIVFEVTAFGEDAYVDKDSGLTTDGVQWSVVGDTFTGNATSNLDSTADEETNTFRVEEGQTETFTLTVDLFNAAGTAGYYGVQIDEIGFNDTDAAADTWLTAGLEDLETDEINLQ